MALGPPPISTPLVPGGAITQTWTRWLQQLWDFVRELVARVAALEAAPDPGGDPTGWVVVDSVDQSGLSNQTDNDTVLMSAAVSADTLFRFSGWIHNLTFGNGFGGMDADFTDCEGNAINPYIFYGLNTGGTYSYNADQSGERVGYFATTLCVNAGTTLNIRFDCGGGLLSTFRAVGTLEQFIPP